MIMVYDIGFMFDRFRRERGAIKIVDELFFKGSIGVKSVIGVGYEKCKFAPGRYSHLLITIKDDRSLEDQVISVIHEWLHLEPPFLQYIIDTPRSIEELIEKESEEVYHQDPEGVEFIRWLLGEAHKVKPQKYFVP